MSEAIRASPYEPGLYFVEPEPGTTRQSIGSQQWQASFGRGREVGGALEAFFVRDSLLDGPALGSVAPQLRRHDGP